MHSNWRDSKEWEDEGLKLSSSCNEACKLFDAALTQYVGWYEDPALGGLSAVCEKMLKSHPDFIMGKVLAYGLQLLATGKSIRSDSSLKMDMETMISLAASSQLTWREQLHVKAIDQWSKGLLLQACDTWESLLVEHPRDMLAAKFAHDTYFYLGKSVNIRDCIARILPQWNVWTPLYGYLNGMFAFGLEETNLYAEAEKYALKGLEMNQRDAWATHALAHVFEMTGEQTKGIELMSRTETDWSTCGMLAAHNYWHLALYYLEKGDYETVLSIYDSHIGPLLKNGVLLDIVDSSSLLYRLHLEGVDVSSRWKDVGNVCKKHTEDHIFVFNDVHFLMSLLRSRDNDSKNALLLSMESFIKSFSTHHQATVAEKIGLPMCKAFEAYEANEYDKTVDALYPIRYSVIDIGGSHAQRDLFNLLLINAAIKSHRTKDQQLAKALLYERKALKENSPLTDRLKAKLLAAHR